MNKFLTIIMMICFISLYGQAYESTIPGLNITAPSASGIASKIKSPTALATGIPDIGIPFFTLPTHSKNVAINVGLSYHPNNTLMGSKASDVGLGWSLYGSGNVIFREMNPDNGTLTNKYHFNFLGRGGSFQFTNAYNELSITKVTENKLQFFATETSPSLYKFKIVDENGISYLFETLDKSYYYDYANGGTNKSFTGCYYLTNIRDINGSELVTFEYQEDNYTVPQFLTSPSYLPLSIKSLKTSRIISKDFGSIDLAYTFNASERRSYQDPFALNSVILKNKGGKQLQKFVLQQQGGSMSYPIGYVASAAPTPCSWVDVQGKRMLSKILKYGTDSYYETTEIKYPAFYPENNFETLDYWTEYPNLDPLYKCFPEESKNPKYLGIGLLQSIKYPNGTEVKYTFEPNQYYEDKSFPDYQWFAPPGEVKDREAQYFEDIGDYPFDVQAGPGMGYFVLPSNPDEPDGYSYLFFHISVGELYTGGPLQPENANYFVDGALVGGIDGYEGYKKYPPGKRSFTLSGTGGRGTVHIKRIRYKSLPLPNYSTGKGVRIKKIEYLENNTVNNALTRRYDYERFDGSNVTSGDLNDIEGEQSVVYKNIKESIGQNNGYTKYYYKTLFDPPSSNVPQDTMAVVGNVMKHVNILKDGLLEKREVFNANNILIQKDSIYSEMETLKGIYIAVGNYYGQPFNGARNGIVKSQKTISTLYNSSGSFSVTSEITRDKRDFNIVSEKKTAADGTITETNITYPWQYYLIDPRLWNANMVTVPLIVETKKNGVTVSKSETRFDNASHFYPTSQISSLPDNLSQTQKNISYDIYDDKGNPVQITSFPDVGSEGVPTTIIYGYNKTLPIAKIEGAKLSDIPSNLITAIVNASNEDANAAPAQEDSKEQVLIAALNTFKNDSALQNFMVTCYTYNPLIGITTTIPPNGLMEFYKYDAFNRLQKVVDVNGNTVKEHLYNYKN